MLIGISDKVLNKWLEGKEHMGCSDEGEALAIAAGHFLATGERATVFMSGDGFMNALNFFTSWIMVDPKIEVNIIISTGRTEDPHKVVTGILPELLELLNYDTTRISIRLMQK